MKQFKAGLSCPKSLKVKSRSRVVKRVIQCLVALLATSAAGAILIPLAYLERGYQAIGGEYLMMVVIFLVVFHLGGRWLDGADRGAIPDRELD